MSGSNDTSTDKSRLQRKIERLQANIPKELQQRDQWVMWKAVPNKKTGKMDKVPYQTNGTKAKNNDPETWAPFDRVLSTLEGKPNKMFNGVGYVFSKDDPFCGVDLDNCVNEDGQIEKWALDWITRFNSYTEWSVSGKGIHIISTGNLGERGGKHTNIKDTDHDVGIFDTTRYFIFTGELVKGHPQNIRESQEQIDALYSSLKKTGRSQIPEGKGFDDNFGVKKETQYIAPSIDAILDKIQNVTNADKIQRLINGDITGYTSQSEADEALCFHLAFWTVDAGQIYKIIQTTELYLSDDRDQGGRKWDRHTYLAPTIGNALWMVKEHFTWKNTQPKAATEAQPEPTEPEESEEDIPRAEPIDGKTFVNMTIPKKPMLVGGGLIPGLGFTMMAGYAKAGKTTFAMQMCISITSGTKLLNTFNIEKENAKVLYTYLENDPAAIQETFKSQIADWGTEVDPTNISFLEAHGMCLDYIEDREWLQSHLESVDLCVIDPVSLAMKKSMNDYEVVRAFATMIKTIGRETDTAFLLIHNLKKPGAVKQDPMFLICGSTAWINIAESIITLGRWDETKPPSYSRLAVKPRYAPEPDDMCIYRNNNTFELFADPDRIPKARTENVVNLVKDFGPIGYNALTQAVMGEESVQIATAKRKIASAVSDKLIIKDVNKKYVLPQR